ncbi:MAG: glycosyl hydrolase family 18 protein [Chloroflexia bacterium]
MFRRTLQVALVLACVFAGLPGPASVGAAEMAAGQTIRWGYYVTYAGDSLVSLKANIDALTHVSPYYYELAVNGTIDARNEQPETTAFMRSRGVKILPMIKNAATYDAFKALIDTPEKQDKIVAAIVALVVSKNYDGINIDWEGVNAADRPLLTEFMKRLRPQMQAKGKLTTMAVAAKASDVKTGWGGSYDYVALAPHVDFAVLMAYDYHYQGGKDPGAVAPVGWVRQVAKFAATSFGKEKVILGVPFYGFDWNVTKGPPARTVKMVDGPPLAQKPGATSGYNATDEANWVRYRENDEDHEAWYEDERSVAAKLAVMTELQLAGFAAWRIGHEGAGAWNAIRRLDTPATRVPPVPNTATQYYFPETGQVVAGVFLKYWQQYGGLAQFGLPRTREFEERSPYDNKLYKVQYFERARFEYHPEYAGTPYEVLLGLLGRDFHQIDPPAAPKEGQSYFAQTGHNLGGAFREYWLSHGGLFVSGLPISEEFTEVSPDDGKTYTVQYFERARYEFHPENKGTPYEVLLGLLGNRIVRERGWIP